MSVTYFFPPPQTMCYGKTQSLGVWSHLLNQDAMTQILIPNPTIHKQHLHITDGFSIWFSHHQWLCSYRINSKALKRIKTNSTSIFQDSNPSLLQGCTKILSALCNRLLFIFQQTCSSLREEIIRIFCFQYTEVIAEWSLYHTRDGWNYFSD